MARKIFRSLSFLIIIFCFCGLLESKVYAINQSKTVRVGFPHQEGLLMLDEDGNYSGYIYDYLMEISQYTGWNYEFVEVEGSLNEQLILLMDMLKNGEIDLLGGFYYQENLTEIYLYSSYSCGTNYAGLFVPSDSELTESTLYTRKNIKIGVYSKNLEKHKKLEEFANMNNLNMEQIVTDSRAEIDEMLEKKEIDAILSTDLAIADHKGMRAVAHFSPSPFYFITTKGNVEIMRQMDYAITTINQVNPNYVVQLYNHYFLNFSDGFSLTEEEKAFVQISPSLKVAIYGNKPPFQYIDKSTGKPMGITIEILEDISKKTGLQFEYKVVSTYQEYINLVRSGEVDISGDALLNYQDAAESGSTFTISWYNLPVYLVFKEGEEMREDGQCAIPYFLRNALDFVENPVYFDTVEECMKAVQDGTVNYAYVGEFCCQYFLNSGAYQNLKVLNQQNSMSQKLCFGITDSSNSYLISIFNKYITYMQEYDLGDIVYRNTYKQQQMPFLLVLKNNIGAISITVLVIILFYLILYIHYRNKKQKKIAFENERYNTLSNLSNEFFYEYDWIKDQLILPDKCAAYFSCEKKISQFAKTLHRIKEADRVGIWQLGSSIIESKETGCEVSCQLPDMTMTRQWFKLISYTIRNQKEQIRIIGKIVNIQESKTKQIRLEQKAMLDGLTGLYNIITIKGLIQKRLESFEQHKPCALIILDVDSFKAVNDQFGHYSGDAVLIQISNLIFHIFHSNLAGRLGGDEFIIFTEKMSYQTVKENCTLLCDLVREKTKEMLDVSITLSIGITFVKEGKGYEEIYQEADQALYQTKFEAKDGYTVFQGKL